MPESRGSQAGPSRQRQQRRGDLKCLAGMISPQRLIAYVTAAACSAVCRRARACLLLIFIPACVSICERPRFTSGPGKRVRSRMCWRRRRWSVRGPGWRAVRPLRGGVLPAPPVASCTISQLDGNRKSPRSAPPGGPETSTTVSGSLFPHPGLSGSAPLNRPTTEGGYALTGGRK